MFSRYFWREQVQRYRASLHKARIDHVAGSLVAQRYLDVVVADHLREWLRLTTYFDTKGLPLPSSVHASDVQAVHRAATRRSECSSSAIRSRVCTPLS